MLGAVDIGAIFASVLRIGRCGYRIRCRVRGRALRSWPRQLTGLSTMLIHPYEGLGAHAVRRPAAPRLRRQPGWIGRRSRKADCTRPTARRQLHDLQPGQLRRQWLHAADQSAAWRCPRRGAHGREAKDMPPPGGATRRRRSGPLGSAWSMPIGPGDWRRCWSTAHNLRVGRRQQEHGLTQYILEEYGACLSAITARLCTSI